MDLHTTKGVIMVNVYETKEGKILIEFDDTTRKIIPFEEAGELFKNLEDSLFEWGVAKWLMKLN